MTKITYAHIRKEWHRFNLLIFAGCLRPPPRFHLIYARGDRDLLGWVWVREENPRIRGISLNFGKHESVEDLLGTLIHEMVHQYEYEVLQLRGKKFDQHKRFDEWQDYLEVLGLPYNIMEQSEFA